MTASGTISSVPDTAVLSTESLCAGVVSRRKPFSEHAYLPRVCGAGMIISEQMRTGMPLCCCVLCGCAVLLSAAPEARSGYCASDAGCVFAEPESAAGFRPASLSAEQKIKLKLARAFPR